jgi:hypothetical protein
MGVAVALNIALCVMDSRILTKAGHDIAGWWVLIVPVYLFRRAKHLGQQPWYALTWLVVLVLSVVAVPAPDYSTPKITTYQGQLLIPGQPMDFSPSGHLTFDQAANPVSNGQLSVKYDFTAGVDSWQISKARIELVDPKGQIATPSTGGTLTDLQPGQDSQGVMTFNVVASPPSGTYVLRYHCITHECSVGWKITVP